MKTVFAFTMLLFFGCGYSQSRTRLVSSPAGMRVRESATCVGMGCGNYGYASGYGQWAMGPAPYQGLAPSWGRFGMIETYRAQNRWVMSPAAGNGSSGTRDPRLDRLVPHLRNMTNAMCRNGTLSGDDCATPRRAQQESPSANQPAPASNPAPTQPAATNAPAAPPAPQEASAPQAAAPPDSGNTQEGSSGHQRRQPITADELE